MATIPRRSGRKIEYPTSDGKPMAETDVHRDDMVDLIATLRTHFAADPQVYVSGNLLLFYEEGNRRRHVSPDVFVVRGVAKEPPRLNYLVWEEGKAPDLVIELTSKSTRAEDQKKRMALYRDTLHVPEYFLFDPYEDYLEPPMQGHRLAGGDYHAVAPVGGRLPSAVLGMHLERDGTALRLFDPKTRRRLPTPQEEAVAAKTRADAEAQARQHAETRADAEAQARQHAEGEAERLRRELEAWKRGRGHTN